MVTTQILPLLKTHTQKKASSNFIQLLIANDFFIVEDNVPEVTGTWSQCGSGERLMHS